MGKLYITIGDEVEQKFRIAVLKIKGKKKGALSEAVEEAIKLWLDKHEKQES